MHCVLFFGAAFGYHKCEGHKGVVGYAFGIIANRDKTNKIVRTLLKYYV